MTDDRAKPIRSAITPPQPVTVSLTWVRRATGKLPAENDARPFLLLLATGAYVTGKRMTLRRVPRSTGSEFVRNSVSGALPVLETWFADPAGQPIDDVLAWAAIEGP
jgi:hypothetical protein